MFGRGRESQRTHRRGSAGAQPEPEHDADPGDRLRGRHCGDAQEHRPREHGTNKEARLVHPQRDEVQDEHGGGNKLPHSNRGEREALWADRSVAKTPFVLQFEFGGRQTSLMTTMSTSALPVYVSLDLPWYEPSTVVWIDSPPVAEKGEKVLRIDMPE